MLIIMNMLHKKRNSFIGAFKSLIKSIEILYMTNIIMNIKNKKGTKPKADQKDNQL